MQVYLAVLKLKNINKKMKRQAFVAILNPAIHF
jgi:hypothetical protein